MDWLVSVAIVVILLLPLAPLLLMGSKRNWSFRRYGPYLLTYVFLVALSLLAGVGVRGLLLVLGALAAVGGAGIAFLMYARVLQMGEEAQRRNKGS
jgi:hypothetical protein